MMLAIITSCLLLFVQLNVAGFRRSYLRFPFLTSSSDHQAYKQRLKQRAQLSIRLASSSSLVNHMDPKGLVVLITGCTGGFGAATAMRFIKAGSKVIGTGRRAERLDALKAELGPNLHTINADVVNTNDMKAALENLPTGFRAIDILVNNAGLGLGLMPADKADLEDWNQMIDTNIKGLVSTTRLILPGMVERGKGHIINLGSVAGTYPYPGGNVYGSTKAFVHQFSLNLRADLLGKNIRVSNLEPGMCESEFSLVRFKGDEKRAAGVYEGMKAITSEDIAEVIYWTATLPNHININTIELMPTAQAFSSFAVARDAKTT